MPSVEVTIAAGALLVHVVTLTIQILEYRRKR